MAQKFICFTMITCLLILSCSSYGEARPPHKARPAHKGSMYYYTVPPQILLPKPTCSDSMDGLQIEKLQKPNANEAHLPLIRGNQPNGKQLFLRDIYRADLINGRGKKTRTINSIDGSQSASRYSHGERNGNFHTTLAFGTPEQTQTLIIDTGSDITWVQCQPCTSCYNQTEPRFDPSKSSTYSNTSCISGSGNTYDQHYEDNSYSSGVFGCDKLTLPPYDVVQNFQFGCGTDNSDDFGENAGVLGLGRGQLSLMSQAASQFNQVFSYCLPKDCSVGYLLFGHQATKHPASSSLKYTPLLQPSGSTTYYYVELVGISVAGKKLKISSSVLASMQKHSIVDSGTVITRLPSSVYAALQSAFNSSMSIYPSAPNFEILDTCYNLKGHNMVSIPKVVLHFGGGTDVSLQPHGTVWAGKSLSRVCLAFAANHYEDDHVIIGNTQQQSMQVLYDLKEGRIGFGACKG
ncbi:Xylanase inhibitor, C-terminal [Dillenia turbinata]|uniref:Xylanase inhibitor, C-terminal n=1 Tax=Dillenia turbinata TaxID=194707 RepID=A0AAN8VHE0_9MAGN